MKNDTELMIEAQGGCESAFETLMIRHQAGMYSFFMRMHGNTALAEDQTQDVFLKLFRNAGTYTPSAKFTTYLYRIARTVWIDWVRKEARHGKADSLDAPTMDEGSWHNIIPGPQPRPDQVLIEEESTTILLDAVAELPETHKMVFLLAVQEEMRYSDIADVLEIPEGTVKSRMHHAVSLLREKLQRARIAPSA